jgi:hypothetical protein
MSSILIAGIGVACMFGGALLGLGLQRFLPRHHLDKDSQDVVKLGAGVIATVTALVLGLLISSAKGTFDEMNSRIIQGGARIARMDDLLGQYGPEAKPVREQLRQSVEMMLYRIWPSKAASGSGMTAIERGDEIRNMQNQLRTLTPGNDTQRELLSEARRAMGEVAELRWMLIEEAQKKLPTALLVVLFVWLAMLFGSFGLFAPRNVTVLVVLFMCACSMAGAIFLMLEMNRPLDGFIKVSSAPLSKTLELMGR